MDSKLGVETLLLYRPLKSKKCIPFHTIGFLVLKRRCTEHFCNIIFWRLWKNYPTFWPISSTQAWMSIIREWRARRAPAPGFRIPSSHPKLVTTAGVTLCYPALGARQYIWGTRGGELNVHSPLLLEFFYSRAQPWTQQYIWAYLGWARAKGTKPNGQLPGSLQHEAAAARLCATAAWLLCTESGIPSPAIDAEWSMCLCKHGSGLGPAGRHAPFGSDMFFFCSMHSPLETLSNCSTFPLQQQTWVFSLALLIQDARELDQLTQATTSLKCKWHPT